MGKFTYFLIAVFAVVVYTVSVTILSDGEFPDIPDYYWGPKHLQSQKEDVRIHPFKINVTDKILEDLKSKLKEEISSIRVTPPLEDVGFQYGFNTKYLKTVSNYWLTKYDWRKRETLLNKYPQFKTKIAGINIHFQHIKSANNSKYKKTRPILVVHGWPGTFVEHQKIIPLLTDPADSDTNFEIIIPSLPGYGFSEGGARPGLDCVATAQIFFKLMTRLGHDRFYVQGGDWGHMVAAIMSAAYPKNVIGMHSNMCISTHPRSILRGIAAFALPSVFLTQEEADRFLPISRYIIFLLSETGYMHLQGTKPDTVGVALSHSPTGLAAYILEKFSTWTNINLINREDGGIPASTFTVDELLDNVMVYWVTKSITTAMRYYKENAIPLLVNYDNVPVKIPSGCLVPRYEPYTSHTKALVQDKFQNLLSYNYANVGGHFISMEHPKILADDIIRFVKKVEGLPAPEEKTL